MLDVVTVVDREEQDELPTAVPVLSKYRRRKAGRSGIQRAPTVSGVTAEAGAVFEHVLRRTHSDSGSSSIRVRPFSRGVGLGHLASIAETSDSGDLLDKSTDNKTNTLDSVDTRLSSAMQSGNVSHDLADDGTTSKRSSFDILSSTDNLDGFDNPPSLSDDAFLSTSRGTYSSGNRLDRTNRSNTERAFSGHVSSKTGTSATASSSLPKSSATNTMTVSVDVEEDSETDADDEIKRVDKPDKKKKTMFQRIRERLHFTFSRQEDRDKVARKASKYMRTNETDKKKSRFSSSFRRKGKKTLSERDGSSTTSSYSGGRSHHINGGPAGDGRFHSHDHPKSQGFLSSLQRRVGESFRRKRSQSRADSMASTSQSADELGIHPITESQRKKLNKYSDHVDVAVEPSPVSSGMAASNPRTGHHSFRNQLDLPIQSPLRPSTDVPVICPERPEVSSDLEERVRDWDFIDGDDEVDGLTLEHATSRTFTDKSPTEKEELYEQIASQLISIGDSYNIGTPSAGGCSDTQPEASASSATVAVDIGTTISHLLNTASFGYGSFCQAVSEAVRGETGIQQIAIMFQLSSAAIEYAGTATSLAGNIKDMTMRYFQQFFAPWVVEQGGWESVVETDSELD